MFDGIFQPTHLLIVLLIVLLIFGPGKLPQLGGAMGKTIREFRRGVGEGSTSKPEIISQVFGTTPETTNIVSNTETVAPANSGEYEVVERKVIKVANPAAEAK